MPDGSAVDAGGIIILSNGHIVHIDPWNPDAVDHNALMAEIVIALATIQTAAQLSEADTRAHIQQEAVTHLEEVSTRLKGLFASNPMPPFASEALVRPSRKCQQLEDLLARQLKIFRSLESAVVRNPRLESVLDRVSREMESTSESMEQNGCFNT